MTLVTLNIPKYNKLYIYKTPFLIVGNISNTMLVIRIQNSTKTKSQNFKVYQISSRHYSSMTFSFSENIQLLWYNADLSIFKVVCQLAIFNPLPNVQMKYIIFFFCYCEIKCWNKSKIKKKISKWKKI